MRSAAFKLGIILSIFIFYSFYPVELIKGKIGGFVTDAITHKPIPNAVVELLKSGDSTLIKTTTSNDDGRYIIENVAYGKYFIRVSCLGYRRKIGTEFEVSGNIPLKLETINLFTESKTLNEVVITGRKLSGYLKDDKIIYNIDKKSTEFAHSGIELLRQIPDITVDYISENVKLAGRSNIQFQVDGRKVDRNYLAQLNPELVDKVEVITTPGAKYDSDIDAVINFILKKDLMGGISGRAKVTIPTSATILTKSNANIDLYFKNIRLYAGGNYNQRRYDTETSSDRTTFSSDPSRLRQNSECLNTGKKMGLSYGFDWFLNKNNTLNFYNTIRPQIPEETDIVTDNVYSSSQISTHNISKSRNVDKNYFYDYSLFYQHKFARKFHEISFEGYLSKRNSAKDNNYYEQDYISEGVLSDQLSGKLIQGTDSKNEQMVVKVDYIYPFSEKFRLSTGYNGYFSRADYQYQNIIDNYTDWLNYDENRHVAYGNLSLSAGKIDIQSGVRYEFSDIHLTHGYNSSRYYNFLLPSASILYKSGKKNSVRINYRKAVNRPLVNQLSPMSYKEDSYLQSTGNPNLKPSIIDRFELTHRIQTGESSYLSYRPYINIIKGDIRLLNLSSSDSVLQRKYLNAGNNFEYGATLSGGFNLLKNWTLNTSWTYYHLNLKALPEFGITEDFSRSSWRLNLSTQYTLPKDWTLFIEYNYNAPVYNYQSTTHRYYDFVTGFNKMISKKFALSVFTLNPWNAGYVFDNKTITSTNMVQNSKDLIKYKYLVLISIGYKFKSGKIGKRIERQVETEEEKGTNKGILN